MTVRQVVNVDEDLTKRIDSFHAQLEKTAGMPVSRAAVLRVLLQRGLDAAEKDRRAARGKVV